MGTKRGLKEFIDEWRRERPDVDLTAFSIAAAIKRIDLQTEAAFRRFSAAASDFGIGPAISGFCSRFVVPASPIRGGRQICFNRCSSPPARSPSNDRRSPYARLALANDHERAATRVCIPGANGICGTGATVERPPSIGITAPVT